jgi:hypothetical protein
MMKEYNLTGYDVQGCLDFLLDKAPKQYNISRVEIYDPLLSRLFRECPMRISSPQLDQVRIKLCYWMYCCRYGPIRLETHLNTPKWEIHVFGNNSTLLVKGFNVTY